MSQGKEKSSMPLITINFSEEMQKIDSEIDTIEIEIAGLNGYKNVAPMKKSSTQRRNLQ